MEVAEASGMGTFVYTALFVFSVWMIVDAVRKRVEFYWYLIILLAFPLGSLIYFFVIKMRDFQQGATRSISTDGSRPSFGSFKPEALGSASIPVQLAAADALESSGRYTEAIPRYAKVLDREPKNPQALHGMARCMTSTGKPEQAVELLSQLLSDDNAYRNYSAALEYAEALWQSGQREDCLQVLEQLVLVTGRINHRLALAHYSLLSEMPGRAREVLQQALADHASQPEHVQRQQQHWADRAAVMLSSVQPVS